MSKIKNLFSTPKKAIISAVVIIVILGIIAGGTVITVRAVAKSRSIGESRAEQIALADAGTEVSQARFRPTEFSFDDGRFVYEVEFYTENGEFEYVIDASDGTIIERDADIRQNISHNTINKETNAQTNAGTENQTDATTENHTNAATDTVTDGKTDVGTEPSADQMLVSLESAKQAALADAGMSSADVTFTKEKTDYENGISIYDLEFYSSDAEYDYEINAATGEILSKSMDTHLAQGNTSQDGTDYISVDKAKEIALADSKTDAASANFIKAKLENDDGKNVYEIEFLSGGTEYDYKINAADGTILESDFDKY